MDNIVYQLVNIYFTRDYGNGYEHHALTDLEAKHYYNHLMRHRRINLYMKDEEVIGYLESWRLDFEQAGRVVCWSKFNSLEEEISSGPVAYIADIWIDPRYRNENIQKVLIEMFKEDNKDADYFISERLGKSNSYRYIRVYDKENGYKLNKE